MNKLVLTIGILFLYMGLFAQNLVKHTDYTSTYIPRSKIKIFTYEGRQIYLANYGSNAFEVRDLVTHETLFKINPEDCEDNHQFGFIAEPYVFTSSSSSIHRYHMLTGEKDSYDYEDDFGVTVSGSASKVEGRIASFSGYGIDDVYKRFYFDIDTWETFDNYVKKAFFTTENHYYSFSSAYPPTITKTSIQTGEIVSKDTIENKYCTTFKSSKYLYYYDDGGLIRIDSQDVSTRVMDFGENRSMTLSHYKNGKYYLFYYEEDPSSGSRAPYLAILDEQQASVQKTISLNTPNHVPSGFIVLKHEGDSITAFAKQDRTLYKIDVDQGIYYTDRADVLNHYNFTMLKNDVIFGYDNYSIFAYDLKTDSFYVDWSIDDASQNSDSTLTIWKDGIVSIYQIDETTFFEETHRIEWESGLHDNIKCYPEQAACFFGYHPSPAYFDMSTNSMRTISDDPDIVNYGIKDGKYWFKKETDLTTQIYGHDFNTKENDLLVEYPGSDFNWNYFKVTDRFVSLGDQLYDQANDSIYVSSITYNFKDIFAEDENFYYFYKNRKIRKMSKDNMENAMLVLNDVRHISEFSTSSTYYFYDSTQLYAIQEDGSIDSHDIQVEQSSEFHTRGGNFIITNVTAANDSLSVRVFDQDFNSFPQITISKFWSVIERDYIIDTYASPWMVHEVESGKKYEFNVPPNSRFIKFYRGNAVISDWTTREIIFIDLDTKAEVKRIPIPLDWDDGDDIVKLYGTSKPHIATLGIANIWSLSAWSGNKTALVMLDLSRMEVAQVLPCHNDFIFKKPIGVYNNEAYFMLEDEYKNQMFSYTFPDPASVNTLELAHNSTHVSAFPNPSRGIIQFDKEVTVQSITDMQGRKHLFQQRHAKACDASLLPVGLYIISGLSENKTFKSKVIIMR